MGKEIERKFLVTSERWRENTAPRAMRITQGYLIHNADHHVRIRTMQMLLNGEESDLMVAHITIKSNSQLVRDEYEYQIPVSDAKEMINKSKQTVKKDRYYVPLTIGNDDGSCFGTWEIDVFENGMVVVEIEINDPDDELPKPDWLGKEVTYDPRFYNVNISSMSEKEIKRITG